MKSNIKQISEEMSLQFAKDMGYVDKMKENPRNAILTELGIFWNFTEPKNKLFDQPNLI